MDLGQHIDVYCERTDFTFWSEPLNALSNIAFLISAWFCYRLYRQHNIKDVYAAGLIALLTLTGIGSFLFHTFATRWAGMADVIPIVCMVFLYHFATMRRVAYFGYALSTLSLGVIPLLVYASSSLLPDSFDSTRIYAPVIILFSSHAVLYFRKNQMNNVYLLCVAIILFILSMTMRVFDDIICNQFPYGLHYFWHILNAVTLYVAFRAYLFHPSVKI